MGVLNPGGTAAVKRRRVRSGRRWWSWAPLVVAFVLVLVAVGLQWPQIPAALGSLVAPEPDDPDVVAHRADPAAGSWRPIDNDCSGGNVYLTFDDGPSDTTPALLDRLEILNLKATFFVVGDRIPGREAIVRRALAGGHSVQNHTFHHVDLVTGVDVDGVALRPWGELQIRAELVRGIEAIVGAGAPRPTLYRPPYGEVDAGVDRVAAELGLRLVMPWPSVPNGNIVDSTDSDSDTEATFTGIVGAVTAGLQADAIVTMHDGTARSTIAVIDALQPIVDEMNAGRLCSSTAMRADAGGGRLG